MTLLLHDINTDKTLHEHIFTDFTLCDKQNRHMDSIQGTHEVKLNITINTNEQWCYSQFGISINNLQSINKDIDPSVAIKESDKVEEKSIEKIPKVETVDETLHSYYFMFH